VEARRASKRHSSPVVPSDCIPLYSIELVQRILQTGRLVFLAVSRRLGKALVRQVYDLSSKSGPAGTIVPEAGIDWAKDSSRFNLWHS